MGRSATIAIQLLLAPVLGLARRIATAAPAIIDSMTSTDKATVRRSQTPHPKFGRKVIVSVGPGDTIGFRLEREPNFKYLPIHKLYEQADLAHAAAITGFNTAPCANPHKTRNIK